MFRKVPFEILLVAIIGLLHLPVVFAHQNYLITWFNTDDAYYYFVTARNVSQGLGFSFDGIARTNGFHPLWMFVLIPVFAIPGLYLPLRLLVVLLVVLNIGSALLLFQLTRRRLSPGVAFVTALAFSLLPTIHGVTTRGGIEAGISAFFIIYFLSRLSKAQYRLRAVLALSGVAALTFLARLDNVFLVYAAGGWLLVKWWWAQRSESTTPALASKKTFREAIHRALVYFVPLSLVLAAYMGWNLIGFGTPVPVSGQVKRWWGTLPNSVYGFPPRRLSNFIGQFVTDDESIGPWAIITGPYYRAAEGLVTLFEPEPTTEARRLALAGLGLLTAGAGGWFLWRQRKLVCSAANDFGLVPLLAGSLFQIGYYKAAGSVAERGWYWVGEKLFVVLAGGMVLETVFRALFSRFEGRKPIWPRFVQLAILSTLAWLLIMPHLSRIPRILSPQIAAQPSFYLRRSGWLEANTEAGARIAMTGSGSSAYYTQGRTLVNLDGLINSYEYFQHMQDNTAADYLQSIGVDYVFGNAYIIQESDPYGGIFENRLVQVGLFRDGEKNLVLWRFVPASNVDTSKD